jgi:short-subunit dehydrogenase
LADDGVVVVTGASAGLGRAIVRQFARQGASIGLMARDIDRLETTSREVERLGGKALAIPTDVADAAQVEAAAHEVEIRFGPIDTWINNAMTSVFSPFKDMTAEEFRRVTEVTYLGVVYGTMSALRRMLPRNRGTIIQVGSALAERSLPLQAAYSGAKHGIRGFTDSLRSELLHDKSNIYIVMVQLPAMNTPQYAWVKSHLPKKARPVPPIFQPEVAARAIYRIARRKNRREFYVGWPTVRAMWANKFFAGFLDLYLGKYGYIFQQTEEAEDPNRPSNLWLPVRGDFGAHGPFDQSSRSRSFYLWAVENEEWIFPIVGVIILALITLGILALSGAL